MSTSAAKPLITARPVPGVSRLLAGMRIRKKLIFLHTCFSLVLAGALALAMRPAVTEVVRQAEQHEATVVLDLLLGERRRLADRAGADGAAPEALVDTVRRIQAQLGSSVQIVAGDAATLDIDPQDAARARGARGASVAAGGKQASALGHDPTTGGEDAYLRVSVTLTGARDAVTNIYILLTLALLAVYGLVALALEMFVLPQHVYAPIRTLLEADSAVQAGRTTAELIPESDMPADEMGEIMRSRNASIAALRRHEHDLALALSRLEEVATDLKRKNHLLEMAQRNLVDADRLASLGMMSAGIAHELNTPLTVLKGLVERLNASFSDGRGSPTAGVSPPEAAMMLRVVQRLERLSESLLDFARARPHRAVDAEIAPLVDEAWTLVKLDRNAASVEFVNAVPPGLAAWCDPDRILQVLVNLLRNAVDATESGSTPSRIVAGGERIVRERRSWARVTVADSGPGLSPELLERLFQPFVTTKLDAHGTGLGLAVAFGIVREHGGLLLARNSAETAQSSSRGEGLGGAIFEMLLPQSSAPTDPNPVTDTSESTRSAQSGTIRP